MSVASRERERTKALEPNDTHVAGPSLSAVDDCAWSNGRVFKVGARSGRHELIWGGTRYRLCRAFDAADAGGRVLVGSAADALLAAVIRAGDGAAIRRAYADFADCRCPHRVPDAELLRWFSAQLGGDLNRVGPDRLALVKLDPWARAAPTSDAQHLVTRLSTLVGELSHRGRRYRLVVPSEPAAERDAASDETLESREAAALLIAMADGPACTASLRAVLREAIPMLSPDAHAELKGRLVLSRLARQGGGAAAAPEMARTRASTPSQLRRSVQPPVVEETHWVEFTFVDDSGLPMASQAYEVTFSDGSKREGALDENGLAYLDGIVPGVCEVTFSGFVTHVAT